LRRSSLIAVLVLLLEPPAGAEETPTKVALIGPQAKALARALSGSPALTVVNVDPVRPSLEKPAQWALLAESLGAQAIVVGFGNARKTRGKLHLEVRDSQGELAGGRVLRGFRPAAVRRWVLARLSALAAKTKTVEQPEPQKPALVKPAWVEPPAVKPPVVKPPVVKPSPVQPPPVKPAPATQPVGEADPFEEDPGTGKPLRAPRAAAAEERRALPFALSGDVWAHHMSYLRYRDAGLINSRNEVGLRLQLDGRLASMSKYLRAHVNGTARFDVSDESRREAFFREAYVEAGWGPVAFCAGKRLLSWGATDAFNPVDVLKQSDLRDPLDIEERGLFLLQARLLLGQHLALAAVFVPLLEAGIIPSPTGMDPQGRPTSSSRWFLAPALPVPPTFVAPSALTDGPEAFQYGGRLSFSSSVVDAALSYAYSYIPFPHFAFEPPSFLRGGYHRRHVMGFDFQWTVLGQLLLKGEAAVSLTADRDGSDPAVPDSYVSYVLQLEHTFSMLGGSDNSLRLLGQFFGEHDLQGSGLPRDLIHPFHFLGNLGAEWKYRDHTAVELLVLYDAPSGVMVRLRAWHELVDGLRLEAGGVLLEGRDDDTFAGLYSHNDRLYAKLRYSF